MGIPFYQGTAEFGDEIPTPRSYCSKPPKTANVGDIFFSVRAPVGEVNFNTSKAGIGRGLCAITCKELTHSRFLWWALHDTRNQLKLVSTGSTYEAVAAEDVGNMLIPFPSFETQTKIADYLDRKTAELDQLISAKKNLLKLLDEKKRALIARAVTRGLNPEVPLKDSDIPWLDMVPEHWEVERARWLFSQSELPIREEDKMVTCFRDGTVTLRSNRREEGFTLGVIEHGYQGIRKNQLVLHSMDAFAGAIGVSDSDGKCTPEYVICDPSTDQTDPHYFGFLLREMALQKFIQAQCSAVRERAPRIRFNQFKDFSLPLPPLEEQREIVEHINHAVNSLRELKSVTEKTIILLQERRTALISAAVTGKLNEEVFNVG
jgi:type I restriction enzyme S subunit